MSYYRCISDDRGECFQATSGGLYEAVSESGELVRDSRGLKLKSDVAEICCSKTQAGAVVASVQSRQTSGVYYLYSTAQAPDIDLSESSSLDFKTLEEVRYRPSSFPVMFEKSHSLSVPRTAIVDIQEAYSRGSTLTRETMKSKFHQLIETGQYPTESE